MFSEDEITSYNKLFCNIGITDNARQKDILEFLYTFGTIVYNINKYNSIEHEKA